MPPPTASAVVVHAVVSVVQVEQEARRGGAAGGALLLLLPAALQQQELPLHPPGRRRVALQEAQRGKQLALGGEALPVGQRGVGEVERGEQQRHGGGIGERLRQLAHAHAPGAAALGRAEPATRRAGAGARTGGAVRRRAAQSGHASGSAAHEDDTFLVAVRKKSAGMRSKEEDCNSPGLDVVR